MSYQQSLLDEFGKILDQFHQSAPMRRFLDGRIGVGHYKWLLRQIFHHARENPQIQVLATISFRGAQRDIIRKFYIHATSEIGHDQLALNDLATLGEDVRAIPSENPLPATTALLAYPFFQIRNLDPIGYLGYLFFLEFTPTKAGGEYLRRLGELGVPESAMTFLQDHARVDVAHNKMMESYVEALVTTRAEFESVVYAMRTTGHLYAEMIRGAFDQADNPRDWGTSSVEHRAGRPQMATHQN
jgi:hypothetical protein